MKTILNSRAWWKRRFGACSPRPPILRVSVTLWIPDATKKSDSQKNYPDLLSLPVLWRGDLARQLIWKTRTTARINKLPRSPVISKISAWPILLALQGPVGTGGRAHSPVQEEPSPRSQETGGGRADTENLRSQARPALLNACPVPPRATDQRGNRGASSARTHARRRRAHRDPSGNASLSTQRAISWELTGRKPLVATG